MKDTLRSHQDSYPWVIYALIDPSRNVIHYVGCTTQQPPEKRLYDHLNVSIRMRTLLGRWLCSLKKQGLTPRFIILERGTGSAWKEAEQRWIRSLSSQFSLCNMTDGGDGAGLQFAPGAHIARMRRSKSMKGNWAAHPERVKQRSDSMRARMINPELRKASSERMSCYLAQRWNDPAQREVHRCEVNRESRRKAQSEMMKARWSDPDFRLKRKQRDADPETHARRSAAAVKRMQDSKRRETIRIKAVERMADPIRRDNLRRAAIAQWADPIKKEKLRMTMRAIATHDSQQKRSAALKKKWETDPEFRRRQTERLTNQSRLLWNNQELRKRKSEEMKIKSKQMWEKVKNAGCRNLSEYKAVMSNEQIS